jgi:hypothetical protein
VKETYEAEVSKLGRKLGKNPLDISFSRASHGLPSRACDDARRLEYNTEKGYISDRKKALLQILHQLGVIEERK